MLINCNNDDVNNNNDDNDNDGNASTYLHKMLDVVKLECNKNNYFI